MYKIELINKQTKEITTFNDVVDINKGEKMFFKFQIDTTKLEDGDYSLTLYDDDSVIHTDTLRVGDFNVKSLQYKRGEDIYVETVADIRLETKSVTLEDVESTVIPSEGFDGMTSVYINAQAVYDKAYNDGYSTGNGEGYNTGYTDGYDEAVEATTNTFVDNARELDVVDNGEYLTQYSGGEGGLYKKVVVNVPAKGETDFTSIGYSPEYNKEINDSINADIAYSRTFIDKWNPATNKMSSYFQMNYNIVYAPMLDTSKSTSASNMFYNCYRLTYVPPYNTENVTNMDNMFNRCNSLKIAPMLNTSKCTSFKNMFSYCVSLKSVPLYDTQSALDATYMFGYCNSLTEVPFFDFKNLTNASGLFIECASLEAVPHFDFSNVTTIKELFKNCKKLKSIPQFNTSNVTDASYFVSGCTDLTEIPLLDFGSVTNIKNFMVGKNEKMTTLGGFKDLKVDWNDTYCLVNLPNLTYQSVLNVINNLYDFRANGDNTTTRNLKLNSKTMALLSDNDKAMATAKGWTLSA